MRVLWAKAPLLLRRHPPVLAAVVLTAALAALAAAALPLVRAGVESESLAGQLRSMSPLAAGLEVVVDANRPRGGAARRRAAASFARSVAFLGPPVSSSLGPAVIGGTPAAGTEVVALARTGAVDHVHHIASAGGPGVWIADSTAKVTHLRPGGEIPITIRDFIGRPVVVRLRVAGIYRSLEADRGNPYWANWLQDIRNLGPDPEPPPQFVLMSHATFDRIAPRVYAFVENRYEFPVDPSGLSFADAKRLDRRFSALQASLPVSAAGSRLGCRKDDCRTSSSLSAALQVAASDVAAIAPTVSLLSGIGLAIAFGIGVATGLFLVRRRADETHVLFVRGESPLVFGARTAVEAALPAALGLATGTGAALLALRLLAPAGTVTGETSRGAVLRAAIAVLVAVICVAGGAAAAFPRRSGPPHPRVRLLRRAPWEIVPLGAAIALLLLVVGGYGLAHDQNGATHPRLAVFLVPIVAVLGVAGLAARGARVLIGRRSPARPVFLLAVRRLAAARGLLVAVVVAAATAFGTFAYAATLSSSLGRSAAEKAFVSNGSDVQGIVDPSNTITSPFAFPVALAEVDQSNVSLPDGSRADLVAGDPAALRRALRWGPWPDDPRRLLPRLERGGTPIPAVATPGAPPTDAIVDQGARVPIRVVGHAPVPGSSAGRPAYLVPRAALRTAAARLHFLEPAPLANGLLWAKGDPARIIPLLTASNLAPTYLTTLDHIASDPSVAAAKRSYGYVKVIGAAAAALALVALLLYLQARQRAQLIASALVRRMGIGAAADAAAVALEAAVVVAFAAIVGAAAAVAAARPIVHRVDALPQYAPAPVLTVPWSTLLGGGAAAVAVAALVGGGAVALATRADAAEALRVA
ncbi:MAG TPA: hypothetical protein VI408_12700 [Gaiellaceae bacterium]